MNLLCKDIDSYYIFTISGMFDTIECKEFNVPKDIQATLLNRDSSIWTSLDLYNDKAVISLSYHRSHKIRPVYFFTTFARKCVFTNHLGQWIISYTKWLQIIYYRLLRSKATIYLEMLRESSIKAKVLLYRWKRQRLKFYYKEICISNTEQEKLIEKSLINAS